LYYSKDSYDLKGLGNAQKEVVKAGRNPQNPTTASCGLVNTNGNIILQLSAKYAIGTF
jgi:hypothetical protein